MKRLLVFVSILVGTTLTLVVCYTSSMHHQLQVTMYIILPAALSHALRGIVEFVECYYILQDLHQQIIVMSQKLQQSSCHVLAVIVQHVDALLSLEVGWRVAILCTSLLRSLLLWNKPVLVH